VTNYKDEFLCSFFVLTGRFKEQGTTRSNDFAISTVGDDFVLGFEGLILLSGEWGETPTSRNDHSLLAGELELSTAEGLHGMGLEAVFGSDGDEDLADLHPGNLAARLSEGATHASLETIGSGTGQHLVDAEYVPRMNADAKVEGILAGELGNILVGANAGRLERFAGKVLAFHGDKMYTHGEFLYRGLLLSQIIDTNLRVRNSTTISGLYVWLILSPTIASKRACVSFGNRK